MIRLGIPVVLVLSMVTILGCQGHDAQVPMDPFYGQTKIAPPATGEITRRPAVDPYYPRPSTPGSGTGVQPPPTVSGQLIESQPSARLAANAATPAKQDAGFSSGDRVEIPISARRELTPEEMLAATTRPDSEPAAATVSPEPPAEPRRVTQTVGPRDQSIARQSNDYTGRSQSPATMSSRGVPVDINDLPPADRGAGTLRNDHVQQASATLAETGTAVRIPSRVDNDPDSSRYGSADDYSRLRGQLEYLETDRCWKLRYIPIDRESDDFGGSVVIKESGKLSGFERGDFVEVRGRIAKQPGDGTNFAPLYEIESIRGL